MDISSASKRIKNMFNKCNVNSKKSNMTNKHSAIITRGGKIYSIGFNNTRTRHNKINNIFATHAEVHALTRLKEKKKCVLCE